MKNLFKITGFITYISMLFLNAFVDLGHKIIVQNTIFKSYDGSDQIILTAIVNALILLPFVLLFTPSGYLADKFSKNLIMRASAWFALGITLLITLGYYLGWFWFSFSMTFLLAVQSALYSPAKYGYIKELVGKTRLAQGNGVVQAATMIAILASTFAFSILFETLLSHTEWASKGNILQIIAPLGWILVGMTAIELTLAYRVPKTTETKHDVQFDWSSYRNGKTQRANIKIAWNNQFIWLSIIGLSIFWSVSQVILATYPAFVKEYLLIDNTAIVQGMMAFAGIGIMIGSIIVARISKNHIETGLIPVGAIGLTIAIIMITQLHSPITQAANFLFLGIMGSFFVIPLRALMQYHAADHQLGRVLASFNFIENIIMLGFLFLTIILVQPDVFVYLLDKIGLIDQAQQYHMTGLKSTQIFSLLGIILVIGASYTIYKLPQSLIRFIFSRLFSTRYRIKIQGFDNIPAKGGILLLGNHISWIDWAIIQIASPRHLHFVIEKSIYQKWYLKWFLDLFGVIPISRGSSKDALKDISKLLNNGKAVCLFPEGTISRTGQLSEFKQGYERAAAKAKNTQIVPFYMHGLWGSRFSRSSNFLKENRQSGFKRDILIAFGKPLDVKTPADTLKRRIFDLSFSAWQEYANDLEAIPYSWLQVAKKRGRTIASTDIVGKSINHYEFMTGVFRFSHKIRHYSPEQNIGLLLPTSTAAAITNMAVLSLGKTVVNLNFTSSKEALQAAVKQADIQTIYTSSQFLKKLKSRGIDAEEIFTNTRLIYLETIKEEISKTSMLATLIASVVLPRKVLEWIYLHKINHDETAAILFSSGSEGSPKGIELSHKNLAVNARQVADILNTRENDVVMNTLPIFHAFGLLATTLMPLSEGIPIVCHPDPTDVVRIAKGIATYEATLLFGTSTFLRMYIRNHRVHPLMLESLRLVIAGAERLRPEIREGFKLKFNKNIYEGYGATETSPVASVNIPDQLDKTYWKVQTGNKPNSVGLPLPGTSFRIVEPDTLQELATGEDGLILIGGPQVMKGYLNAADKTADAITDIDNKRWYKTGDKGHLDEQGFLTIVDRYSRFAKLGGEMISLTAVEDAIRTALERPDLELIAVNTTDDKKGEKIVLLSTEDLVLKELRAALIAKEINPLMHPTQIMIVDELPKLGSGKTDFSAAKRLISNE